MRELHRVALISKTTEEESKYWLHSHGIVGFDDLLGNSVDLAGEDLKRRQFILSRGRAPIEMYVDADPAMCAWVFENQGIPALMFMNPDYLPVEHRPDAPKSVRTWGSIEEAITKQNLAKTQNFIDKHEAIDHLWDEA